MAEYQILGRTRELFSRAGRFRDLITDIQVECRGYQSWMYLNAEDFLAVDRLLLFLQAGTRLFIQEQLSKSGTFHIAPEIKFLLYWQATIAEFQVGSEVHANAIRLTQRREKELDGKFVNPYLATPVWSWARKRKRNVRFIWRLWSRRIR
jgi:hypothetical protein